MMILFEGRSIKAKNRFMPERMQLQLTERNSTATMTLGDGAPTIAIGDWLQAEDGPAKGIVWRVRSIDTQYDTNTRTVQLEHVINKLKDRLMFGEIKPTDISGTTSNPSASQTIRYILSYQDDFVLGTVERDRSNPYGFNGDSLYAALETISQSLTECLWEYDFSKYPFTLNLRSISMDVVSEMRTDRNIRTLRRTVDRSRMYTRHYPIGKEDLHISGDFVGKNEGIYGIICKTETDQSIDTEAALRAWATERLDRHCEPLVTVTVSGFDLSEATGEPLDKFVIGKACRIPLPEYDTTIVERVSKLTYPDAINEPENVTVTLANELPDVATIIRQEQQKAASGGRGSAKKAGEDHAWFIDTEDHVGMIAEAVAGPGADKDWSRVASIIVDGQGIHQRVETVYDDVERHESAIEVQEDFIDATVKAIGADGNITAASICLAINKAGSQASINADRIILTGKTSINDILSVSSGRAYIKTDLRVNGDVMAGSMTLRSGGSGVTIDDSLMEGMIKKAEVSGNTLTLTPVRGDPINFSKATSLSGAWSSGVFTVTASPQGNSILTSLAPGAATWDGRTGTLTIYATIGTSGAVYNTGKEVTVVYPASTWSYSNLSENNGGYSGSKYYDLDTRYSYHAVTVTVDGESRTLVFRT
jgi:cytoskeletal protein CcmA (bactofilin family)